MSTSSFPVTLHNSWRFSYTLHRRRAGHIHSFLNVLENPLYKIDLDNYNSLSLTFCTPSYILHPLLHSAPPLAFCTPSCILHPLLHSAPPSYILHPLLHSAPPLTFCTPSYILHPLLNALGAVDTSLLASQRHGPFQLNCNTQQPRPWREIFEKTSCYNFLLISGKSLFYL